MKSVQRAALVAITGYVLSSASGQAASDEGRFAIKEAGAQTCERFVAERTAQSNVYFAFRGWAAGYISHHNKLTPDTTDVMSWQTGELVDLLLNNFCKQNPQARYIVAVDTLLKALHSTRLRNASKVVDIKTDTTTLQIYEVVLRRLQQALTERGYYKGEIDGAFGPETSAAISAFQRDSKLRETGYPDQFTLLRLFQ